MEINKNEHYFYVLECSDGTYYGGYSTDINRRIEQHNNGKGAKYTRGRSPVKLLYSESFEDKGDALRAEISFKKLSRQQKEYFLQERRSEN